MPSPIPRACVPSGLTPAPDLAGHPRSLYSFAWLLPRYRFWVELWDAWPWPTAETPRWGLRQTGLLCAEMGPKPLQNRRGTLPLLCCQWAVDGGFSLPVWCHVAEGSSGCSDLLQFLSNALCRSGALHVWDCLQLPERPLPVAVSMFPENLSPVYPVPPALPAQDTLSLQMNWSWCCRMNRCVCGLGAAWPRAWPGGLSKGASSAEHHLQGRRSR